MLPCQQRPVNIVDRPPLKEIQQPQRAHSSACLTFGSAERVHQRTIIVNCYPYSRIPLLDTLVFKFPFEVHVKHGTTQRDEHPSHEGHSSKDTVNSSSAAISPWRHRRKSCPQTLKAKAKEGLRHPIRNLLGRRSATGKHQARGRPKLQVSLTDKEEDQNTQPRAYQLAPASCTAETTSETKLQDRGG